MPKLTSAELQRLHSDVLIRIWGADLSDEDWSQGLAWYHNAHAIASKLASRVGCSVEASAGIIAALSPRVRWESNITDATRLLAGEESGFMALMSNVGKAWLIMADDDADDILGGPKVRAFWHNIAHPTTSDDVTLDVWMLRALVPSEWYDSLASSYNFLARKNVYDTIADAVRIAASERGVRPHELQAALWINARNGESK